MAQTLYDKIWQQHVVNSYEDGTSLLYIDRHLVHEVTSPQAFSGLRERNRRVRHTEKVLAVADHNTPTHSFDLQDCSSESQIQLEALAKNSNDFDILYYPLGSENNGVCHVVAPELGFTLPGTTLVCGDSHTATHGAFGSISFGIGTSEVEHVLATQCLKQQKAKNMRIRIDGELSSGVYPKDVILYIISKIGTAGGTGYAIEFCGEVFKNMSMEGRMTICNMTIEAGARFGLIAPDETTFEFLRGTKFAPKDELFEKAVSFWSSLQSDEDVIFDKEYVFFAKDIEPQVSWGTSPEDSSDINSLVPVATNDTKSRALKYMGLEGNENILGLKVDRVFIGSCTNSRIEDLRIAASIVKDKKVSSEILSAIVVPGSGLVRKQAETEGLDKIFIDAGLEWRLPGCSMCLAMNSDKAGEGERVASTSNRNFEGRQGYKARTHLMSPAMAAAAAICGKIVDVRKFS